jgi:hypothetical protein
MEKIISYSLFGYEDKYYVGAEKNIEVNNVLLPDWKTVIYYHPNLTNLEKIDKLSKKGATVIDVSDVVVGGKPSLSFPYFWRFLSFFDNNITLSRDLDSRLSLREVEYINKWLEEGSEYFIIRDHPWHSPVPSGLFGIKGKIVDFENHMNYFISNTELRWGDDQEILHQYIQNINPESITYFGFDKRETYIPRDDKKFFIGIQLDENDKPTVPSGEECLRFLNELSL